MIAPSFNYFYDLGGRGAITAQPLNIDNLDIQYMTAREKRARTVGDIVAFQQYRQQRKAIQKVHSKYFTARNDPKF